MFAHRPQGHIHKGVDATPPVPWARACSTEAPIPLPPRMDVEKKMATGMFESRTPASGRPSICAAQALVHLFQNGRLSLAANMWHSLALLPHTLVRGAHDVFLVMAQGKYAARAWQATRLNPVVGGTCSTLATGIEAPVNRILCLNSGLEWVCIFSQDIRASGNTLMWN